MKYCVFFTKNERKIMTNTYFFLNISKNKKSIFIKEHSYLPEALNTDNAVLLFVTTNGALKTVMGRIDIASFGM
jgi:hypothetical protein|tara:strand:+ start:261 stop:482 length:222 start_codon:yes stop_codon:yes gene_type:complete